MSIKKQRIRNWQPLLLQSAAVPPPRSKRRCTRSSLGKKTLSSKDGETCTEHSLSVEDSVSTHKTLIQKDHLSDLSLEIICHILHYLPLCDIMRVESLCRRLHEAVDMHLRLLSEIDFTEGQIVGCMPSHFNDVTFAKFLSRCPELYHIYGLNPSVISKRRQRRSETLSVPGVVAALQASPNLLGVETCNIFLLEAILTYLPHLEILRIFQNREGRFPPAPNNRLELTRNARITTLNLSGVILSELPRMDYLKHLSLRWVRFTDPNPFRDFGVPLLRTFVMNNCAGPTHALKYVPLVTGLAAARSLTRLEMVRVPFLGGLIQHVVEDSWRMHGFRQLTRAVFGACKHALEVDLGYLAVTCAHRLEELAVQPSLTKDSLFVSLNLADVDFPKFDTLHLGFVDDFPEQGKWTNEQLISHGLADVTENPAMLTDIGMRAVGQAFTHIKRMTIYNCPHLHFPTTWLASGGLSWLSLKELHLRRCHAVRLPDFCSVLPCLPCLETLILEHMFREPPKGCSRVGLSAGTGLGVSSALVSNTGQDANQDAGNNNQPGVVPANPGPGHNHHPQAAAAGIIPVHNPAQVAPPAAAVPQPAAHVIMPQHHVVDDVEMESEEEYDELVWYPGDDEDYYDDEEEGGGLPDQAGRKQNGNQAALESGSGEKDRKEGGVSGVLSNRSCSSPQPGPSSKNDSNPATQGEHSGVSPTNKCPSGCLDENSSKNAITSQEINDSKDRTIKESPAIKSGGDVKTEGVVKTEGGVKTGEGGKTEGGVKTEQRAECENEKAVLKESSENSCNYEQDKDTCNPLKLEVGVGMDEAEDSLDLHDHSSSITASLKSERESPMEDEDTDFDAKECSPSVSFISPNPVIKSEYMDEAQDSSDLQDPSSSVKASLRSERESPMDADMDFDAKEPSSSVSCSSHNSAIKSEYSSLSSLASSLSCSSSSQGSSVVETAEKSVETTSSQTSVADAKTDTNTDGSEPLCCRCSRKLNDSKDETAVPSTSHQNHTGTVDGEQEKKVTALSNETNPGGMGKGKSLRGKKKGLVKSSANAASNVQVNQSCQAVSEEIREMTKKADDVGESSGELRSVSSQCPAAGQDFAAESRAPPAEVPLQANVRTVEKSGQNLHDDSTTNGNQQHDSCKDVTENPANENSDKNGESQGSDDLEEGKNSAKKRKSNENKKCESGKKGRRRSSRRGASLRRSGKKKPTMCDQATSTSDPVIEEDHEQILFVSSLSLVSITLRHVGVTDLVLQQCHKLNSLTGSACRVLKSVRVIDAPKLQRVSFSQCRKLQNSALVEQICSQPAEKNRLIFLRPMANYNSLAMQQHLFRSARYAYHMCLIHDRSPDPEGTLHNRVRVSSWPDLLANINFELLKFKNFNEAQRTESCAKKYPWGRDIYSMTGMTEDGSTWDLVTDIPWLRPLAQSSQVLPLHPQDAAEGLYCPRAHGHKNTEACLAALVEDISEAQSLNKALYMHSTILYVSTCDLNGQPTPDLYI